MKYLVLLLIVLQFPSLSVACSKVLIKPADAFSHADLVVTGTLTTVKSSWFDKLAFWRDGELDSDRVFEVSVAAYLKGKPRGNIYVENMQYGMCGPFLAVDEPVLLYLNSPRARSQIYSVVLDDSVKSVPAHMLDWRKLNK